MERLDEWTLEEKVGTGGLADVWRARSEDGGPSVALKVLRDPDRSPAHRARFIREGRLLQRMDHSGLPRCYAVVDGTRPYLAIELLDGETLSERVRRTGPLAPEQVTTVAAALLRTLAYLHERGVVHRDVKSSNVFLTDDRRVLLLDLGLAADPTDPLTTTLGDVMGTYAYMAPEQIAGAEVDHRCDLYSVGVTLYEAMAGTRPFHARGAAGYLRAHREGDAPPLADRCPDAPRPLVDNITRLMARDPAARPSSSSIALAMLSGSGGVKRSLNRPPLVGRAAAIGAVHAVLDAGGTLVVLGEIGSGTGRIGSASLRIARQEGCEAIAIRCRNRAPPMDPIDQLARDLTRICGPVPSDPGGLAVALADLCAEGPLLLVVEDAENCSPEAATTLASIISSAPGLAAVLTGVRRPDQIDGHVVELRPLSRDEVQKLVAGMLGTDSPPAGLAHQLHRMSGGLPAIVVLAVKELVTRGALWCEGISDEGEAVWRLDRSMPPEPTTGLLRLFGSVLEGLPDENRRLLEVLAIAAESLPLSAALALAEADPSGEAVHGLARAGLVTMENHIGEEWLVLRRPAVGALVLGRVSDARQAAIHQGLAEVFRAMPPDPWRDQRVAWHDALGATMDRAPGALLALGEALHARGQHRQALDVLSRAARFSSASDRISALLAIVRGEALEAVGRRSEAVDALSAGRRLAEDLADDGLRARALVGLAQVYRALGEEDHAGLLANEAMTLLADSPNDPSLPQALLLAANIHRVAARPDQAAELYHRCIEVAMEQGQREFAAMAHGGLGTMLGEEGHLEDAGRHLRQEATFLRTRAMPQRLVSTLYRLSVTLRRMGRVNQALEAIDEAEEIGRFAELPYERALALVGRAAVHGAVGDLKGARELLGSARVAVDAEAATWIRLSYREVQAELRMITGDRQAALAAYQAAEAEATRAGFAALGSYFLGMVGVLTADPEALTDAMDVLGQGGDRRLAARLLFYGATVGGDAEVLESAEREARASGDQFLLLDVLHASGSPRDIAEASQLARTIYANTPRRLRPHFRALPAVRWAGLDAPAPPHRR